ncbi:MAG: helix-turn-helix domain-containing protein [Rhodopila sp.]
MQRERGWPGATPTGGAHQDNGSDRREIGGRIKSARQNAGLTQRVLAAKLGVSSGAVGQWETGATDRPPVLADLLGVSLGWLLGKSDQVQNAGTADADMQVDLRLLREARRLGVGLHKVVSDARQQRWIEENRDALADANAFLTRHGLWSDGKRQF